MQQQEDPLATFYWYGEVITDPYMVIIAFFSSDDVAHYRKTIKAALLASASKGIYKKGAPGELFFVFKELESLVYAAYQIQQESKKSPTAINLHDLMKRDLYCGKNVDCSEWDYFPRALSRKGYMNPYWAFKVFFTYQSPEKWKDCLEDILYFALVKDNFSITGDETDSLTLYFHLVKLVEAAHLINVRELSQIGESSKSGRTQS
jgi:hypothetical protein